MRVGADPGSISYEKSIITRMGKSSIEVESVEFPEDVTQADFVAKLKTLNDDKNIHAVLIFKPLPEQLDEEEIKYILSPEKDPDALNPTNLGKLMIADERGFFPCTAEGVMELLKHYEINSQKYLVFFKRSGYHLDTLGKIKIQNAAERTHKGKGQHCQKLIAPDGDVSKTAKPHTAAKQS